MKFTDLLGNLENKKRNYFFNEDQFLKRICSESNVQISRQNAFRLIDALIKQSDPKYISGDYVASINYNNICFQVTIMKDLLVFGF
tara:strand:- start:1971 stop:2228 length:258 start_codon:yes stop_codon:yes gene_type:complete